MKCPKCKRKQYWVCGNPKCNCQDKVPTGKKPQIKLEHDGVQCPYCGFTAHIDYREEREMKEALKTP